MLESCCVYTLPDFPSTRVYITQANYQCRFEV